MDNCAYSVDKKCRICGYADVKNVNLFTDVGKNLLHKILTVFPIVVSMDNWCIFIKTIIIFSNFYLQKKLYPNDPLPKNICRKCVISVSNIFNEIQRTMRLQARWISNVRANMPNHNYVQVLDMLEVSPIST